MKRFDVQYGSAPSVSVWGMSVTSVMRRALRLIGSHAVNAEVSAEQATGTARDWWLGLQARVNGLTVTVRPVPTVIG